MKKYLYMAVAAIAALSSCSSDEDIIIDNNTGNGDNATVFTATIEGDETRTTLAQNTETGKYTKVYWANGDKISINGKVYTTESTTDVAEFTPDGDEATALAGKYIAVYPSTIVIDPLTPSVTLPATQTYDATTNGIGNVPMAAVSTTTSLQFKNVCSVLAIKVASGTVKKIKVMADQNLSGNFTLNPVTMGIAASTGEKSVVLDCGDGVTANNSTFYIAIPPQEYSYLQIYLSADGTTYKEAMATKNTAKGTFARNKIYPITYKANAVQLWADGPYFATENVGQATYNSYGWNDERTGGYYNNGAYDINHDTAYKNWGSAWRTPTHEELSALSSNCSKSYGNPNGSYGFTFTGTSSYGSIFLSCVGDPTADRGFAYYWSSTTSDDSNAYYLKLLFENNTLTVNPDETFDRGYCLFVRPVLATPAAAAPVPTADPSLLTVNFPSADCWSKDNNIWANGKTYKYQSGEGTTTATFVPDGDAAEADASGNYCVIYPAKYATTEGKIKIPDDFSCNRTDIPLYAKTTTTSLELNNIFGILALKFEGCDCISQGYFWALQSYVDGWIHGQLLGTFDPESPYQETSGEETCDIPEYWSSDNILYFPIAPGKYNSLQADLTGESDEITYEGDFYRNVTIEAGKIYERTITLQETEVEDPEY